MSSKRQITKAGEDGEKRNTRELLGGLYNGTASTENSSEAPQKITLLYNPAFPLLGIYLK